ncbi:hypothetical protein AWC38_SpisGene22364 [Stylophora pistillata]|uniref:Uncharacterized protein n=1 Tax=Stylophora pistillata TaxID=50429 RepID=A0A2B4RBE1_STYPI|nr:hypothetical protein AWC38_SpisGene22364 [Stylophora pistillata]
MAFWRVLTAALVHLLFSVNGSASQYSGHTDVYVSLNGCDSESCGTARNPCRSIAMAVFQTEWNGHIYLNGIATKERPFDCESSAIHEHQKGIVFEKSLQIVGFNSTPHVSCTDGFRFVKNDVTKPLRIALSDIVFVETPLTFWDCDALKISNCSFKDSFLALSVNVRDNSRMYINIAGSVFFKNNTLCLKISWKNSDALIDQQLVMEVKEAVFSENGVYKKQSASGLITIISEATHPSSLLVKVSCFHIEGFNNYGHFVHLDLPTATTEEIYDNVMLSNNSFAEFPLNHNSLYNSFAKKTRAKFSNLRCSSNHLLRCIRIESKEAKVEVLNSSFEELRLTNQNGGAMLFKSTRNGSLSLFNCNFQGCKARGGGALFANSQSGTLNLNITKVNFTKCTAASYGCAILVGDETTGRETTRLGTNFLKAILQEVRVHGCYGFYNRCDSVRLELFDGTVVINDSFWRNNSQFVSCAMKIVNTGGNADVCISGCTFARNNASESDVTVHASRSQSAGSFLIAHTVMSGSHNLSGKALWINSNFRIELFNVVIKFYNRAIKVNESDKVSYSKVSWGSYPFSMSINNCTFRDNVVDILATSPNPTQVELNITNTIFVTREEFPPSEGLQFFIKPLRGNSSANATIEVDNVTFVLKPCNFLAFLFPGKKTIRIRRSQFNSCRCLNRWVWTHVSGAYRVYELSAGAISVASIPDKRLSPGCVEENEFKDTHPIWKYQTRVEFEDTLFEGNGGLIAGGVYIANGHTTFKRCRFKNNFAVEQSGHVYLSYGTGKADFIDCVFDSTIKNVALNGTTFQKSAFVYSDSGGPVSLKNTTLNSFTSNRDIYPIFDISNGGSVHLDNNSIIQCPLGSKLVLDNSTHFVLTEFNDSFCRLNITVLKYSCLRCPSGFYSLSRATSQGLIIKSTVRCLQCPFGARCVEGGIVAKTNFWGYRNSMSAPPLLTFVTCPEHYCRSPSPGRNGYNSCSKNRRGILCGECIPGYSATLFSTECRKDEECDNYWFWVLTFSFTIVLSLYLLGKLPTLSFIVNRIIWFRKKECQRNDSASHQLEHHTDNAYVKITFYFYQAAELLIVGCKETLLQKVPGMYAVTAAFNFKLRTLNKGLGCPFAGLTSVTKELVYSSTVFLTMADIALIYCVHCVINVLRRNKKPSYFHFMAVIMEVLLLGYERLAETCLKLISCVSIESEKRLYIDANVTCMQWWQYLVLAYIAVFIVPFIVVLYLGSSALYSSSMTATEFLAACVLPLPFLVYWLLRKAKKQPGKESLGVQVGSKDVLEVLHGPFRPPKNGDEGTLYWESVLIGRRFILLVCHSFITSPMLRMVALATVCTLIALHHVSKNPFRDRMANTTETLSLTALIIISIINLTKATLLSFGITITGPYRYYMDIMEWFEIGALAVVPSSSCEMTGQFYRGVIGCKTQVANVIVDITFRRRPSVFSHSRYEVSASLSDVGGLAVGAFDLINRSLSVPRDTDCKVEAILPLMLSLVGSDSSRCRDRAASTLDTIASVGYYYRLHTNDSFLTLTLQMNRTERPNFTDESLKQANHDRLTPLEPITSRQS